MSDYTLYLDLQRPCPVRKTSTCVTTHHTLKLIFLYDTVSTLKPGVLMEAGMGVDTNGGNCSDDFAKLEAIQNGGLSGCIQTNHENAHFLGTPI